LNASQYATLRNQALVAAGSAPVFANPDAFGEGTDWQEQCILITQCQKQNHELSVGGGNDKIILCHSLDIMISRA
jgi:hypothetical protein